MANAIQTKKNLRMLRLACSGAIVGVAVAGLLARSIGVDDSAAKDVLGATTGFATVILIKVLHLL